MSARSDCVGFQFVEEAFGKAAADQQAVAGGQPAASFRVSKNTASAPAAARASRSSA
jgi:hypothetical protein